MGPLKASKPYPTEEQIAQIMKDRKLKRIPAVQYLRRQSAKALAPAPKPAARVTPKVVEEGKAKAHKPAISKGDAKHYDQAAVIQGRVAHPLNVKIAPGGLPFAPLVFAKGGSALLFLLSRY